MSYCTRNTIVNNIVGKTTSYLIDKDKKWVFVPYSKYSPRQAYRIVERLHNKATDIFGEFGENTSINQLYTDGIQLDIHPTQQLLDAYDVKEQKMREEEYIRKWEKDASKSVKERETDLGIDEFRDSNPKYSLAISELIRLKPINDKFNKDWNDYLTNPNLEKFTDGKYVFELGVPSSILQSVGFPNARIILDQERISHLEAKTHDFDLKDLHELVEKIHDPLMVFDSSQGDKKSLELVTSLENSRGRKIDLIIALNLTSEGLKVSKISTAFVPYDTTPDGKYEKGLQRYLDKFKSNKVLYVDKERINVMLRGYRSKPDMSYRDRNIDSDSNIQKFTEFANKFNNPITSEQSRWQIAIAQGNENQLVTDNEIKRAKDKLKKIIPNIPVEIVDDYIDTYFKDVKAVGKFEKGLVNKKIEELIKNKIITYTDENFNLC